VGNSGTATGAAWPRVRLTELVERETGWIFDGRKLQDANPSVFSRFEGMGDLVAGASAMYQLVLVYEHFIEPTLILPVFVTHFPQEIMPLAKESKEFPGFAEVFELAINGQEIAPGYTELNDPQVQLDHFKKRGGQIDEDFITALKYGMPPAGGLGIGIDRLVMAITGQQSIRDVLLFPTMRPE
jgi:lysyl-tRNA synthetase class 2